MLDRFVVSYTSADGRQVLQDRSRYKFDVENSSLVENYLLIPFWDWFTKNVIPEWVAPNLITFTGFLFMVAMYMCLWMCYPVHSVLGDEDDTAFRLISLFSAICMFVYQTLDGCDGKQARRTKSSSPLGEVFDHGADSLTITMVTYSMCLSCGITANVNPHIDLLHTVTWAAFISSHWEHRHTGKFYMGYLSSGDGIFITILVNLANVFPSVRTTLWSVEVIPGWITSSLPYISGVSITLGHILVYAVLFSAAFATFRCFLVVFDATKRSDKRVSFYSTLLDWVPQLIMLSSHVLYARLDRAFYAQNFMLVTTCFGLVFGVYSTTMDVMRVTEQTIPWLAPQYVFSLGPCLIALANHALVEPIIEPHVLLLGLLVWNVLHYLYFVAQVTNIFCTCLNIEAFRITPNKSD